MEGSNLAAAAEWSAPQSSSTDINQQRYQSSSKIGIYGWRKRCLYLFISILMVMVIINMALTLWIVKVMDFSIDGMGKLRIQRNGLRLEGDAQFMHGLYATEINSREDHSMKIESARNLTLNARNNGGDITTRLFLGDQKLEAFATKFTVSNTAGKELFSASDTEVKVGAEFLKVTGIGGAVFTGSVQTSEIHSDYKTNLKIESPTRSLDFDGPRGIKLESRAGDIQASSMKDLKLQSRDGAVKIDAERIYFHLNKLPELKPSINSKGTVDAFQLCVCANGRLFLARPKEHCTAESYVC